MRYRVRIASRCLSLERSDEAGVRVQEIAGQLVVVAHVNGVDEKVSAVGRSKRRQANVGVREIETIGGLSAVTANREVLAIGTAIVPTHTDVTALVDRDPGLVVVVPTAQAGLNVTVHL